MDKQHIIDEILRLAENGKAPGQTRFEAETGIKQHQWRGKYWANWGAAVIEAGYQPNDWNGAHDESFVLESLLSLTRKLGKYPTTSEMALERRSDSNFPHRTSVFRIGNKAELLAKLAQYSQANSEFADLAPILSGTQMSLKVQPVTDDTEPSTGGYVYLVSAQRAYKIGCTRAPYRRVAEIANQSANGAELVHLITTDDPEGIERYWHNRFADKRISGVNKQSGEWFQLSNEEVRAFKRRKSFM